MNNTVSNIRQSQSDDSIYYLPIDPPAQQVQQAQAQPSMLMQQASAIMQKALELMSNPQTCQQAAPLLEQAIKMAQLMQSQVVAPALPAPSAPAQPAIDLNSDFSIDDDAPLVPRRGQQQPAPVAAPAQQKPAIDLNSHFSIIADHTPALVPAPVAVPAQQRPIVAAPAQPPQPVKPAIDLHSDFTIVPFVNQNNADNTNNVKELTQAAKAIVGQAAVQLEINFKRGLHGLKSRNDLRLVDVTPDGQMRLGLDVSYIYAQGTANSDIEQNNYMLRAHIDEIKKVINDTLTTSAEMMGIPDALKGKTPDIVELNVSGNYISGDKGGLFAYPSALREKVTKLTCDRTQVSASDFNQFEQYFSNLSDLSLKNCANVTLLNNANNANNNNNNNNNLSHKIEVLHIEGTQIPSQQNWLSNLGSQFPNLKDLYYIHDTRILAKVPGVIDGTTLSSLVNPHVGTRCGHIYSEETLADQARKNRKDQCPICDRGARSTQQWAKINFFNMHLNKRDTWYPEAVDSAGYALKDRTVYHDLQCGQFYSDEMLEKWFGLSKQANNFNDLNGMECSSCNGTHEVKLMKVHFSDIVDYAPDEEESTNQRDLSRMNHYISPASWSPHRQPSSSSNTAPNSSADSRHSHNNNNNNNNNNNARH